MGESLEGQICYGVTFEEDYEFPWEQDEYGGDIECWWIYEVLGYKPSIEIWDENGDYINGERPPQDVFDAYYEEERKFKEDNQKLPIDLIRYNSYDYPMYIIAVPRTTISSYDSEAKSFDPNSLYVSPEQVENLLEFCNKYDLKYQDTPRWYLTGFCG